MEGSRRGGGDASDGEGVRRGGETDSGGICGGAADCGGVKKAGRKG